MKRFAHVHDGMYICTTEPFEECLVADNWNALMLMPNKDGQGLHKRIAIYQYPNYDEPASTIDVVGCPDAVLLTPDAWYIYGRKSKTFWRVSTNAPFDVKAYDFRACELVYDAENGVVYGWNTHTLFTLVPELKKLHNKALRIDHAQYKDGYWAVAARSKQGSGNTALIAVDAQTRQKRVVPTELKYADGLKIVDGIAYMWGNTGDVKNRFILAQTPTTNTQALSIIWPLTIDAFYTTTITDVFRACGATFLVSLNGVIVQDGFLIDILEHWGVREVEVHEVNGKDVCVTASQEAIRIWDWRADSKNPRRAFPRSIPLALVIWDIETRDVPDAQTDR